MRWLAVAASLALFGCALGGGPGDPREADAGAPTLEIDAGSTTPPPDEDGDGVPVSQDCDDTDDAIGRTAARACMTDCGTGTESCTDGVWSDCDAPTTCECMEPRQCDPGDIDMGPLCGNCGRQERRCQADCTWGPMQCVDEGECMAGAMDSETRNCPTGSAMQTRSRTCDSMCMWGGFGAWGPTCPSGGSCGDGTCGAGETCSACADCRAGHMGTGSGGSSCAGVPEGQWRCVTQSGLGMVSQVCRSGSWVNFNLSPMNCSACVCSFSSACCQPGSPSTGC